MWILPTNYEIITDMIPVGIAIANGGGRYGGGVTKCYLQTHISFIISITR